MHGVNLVTVIVILGGQVVKGFDYIHNVRKYEVVQPTHLNIDHRSKRDLSTVHYQNVHYDETAFSISGCNRHFKIRVQKNRELIPTRFSLVYQDERGEMIREQTKPENCYYHGEVEGRKSSVVVLSTCNGLSGLIRDEDGEEFFIEPLHKKNNTHALFNAKDLIITKKASCGHNHTFDTPSMVGFGSMTDHFRSRRSLEKLPRQYIETAVVADKSKFQKHGTIAKTQESVFTIMNFVDQIYKTLNARVPVIDIIIWNTKNMITVQPDPNLTLDEFKKYTREQLNGKLKVDPDNAQLISGLDFAGSVVGLAGVGTMCSFTSCAINQDNNNGAAVTANTVAHEMGHNLGFMHITSQCKCANEPCVMSSHVNFNGAKGFTDCSINTFIQETNGGKYPCTLDYPDKLFGDPKCGNGYKEKGEECDCGSAAECAAAGVDKCCDSNTCKLKSGAKCADGVCCENCQFKSKGRLCREKFHSDCDLEEFCTGSSSECPRNFYLQDGTSCLNNVGYCHSGVCKTSDQQCAMLWGKVATTAEDLCFKRNGDGSEYGNCGKRSDGSNIPCAPENQRCGKIQCKAKPGETLPKFPIIGSNRGTSIRSYSNGITTTRCTAGKASFGKESGDPTMVQEGTKCAENSFCIEQKCTNISTLSYVKSCNGKCKNGGVCNNNGNCHCPRGYACPYCEFAGTGGSSDSGQGCIVQESASCMTPLVKGLLVLFLLVVPLIALVAILLYRYREPLRAHWTSRRQGNMKTFTSNKDQQQKTTATKTQLKTGAPPSNTLIFNNPYASSENAPSSSHNLKQTPILPPSYSKVVNPPPKMPSKKPPPPPPPAYSSPKNKLPQIGSSPRTPGKLPQINKFNQMDKESKSYPTVQVKQPYR